MELEKSAYRVYERILQDDHFKLRLKNCIILQLIILPLQIIVFFSLVFKYQKNYKIFFDCWEKFEYDFDKKLDSETFITLNISKFPSELENNKYIISNTSLTLVDNKDSKPLTEINFEQTYLNLQFSNNYQLLSMQESVRLKHNFTLVNFVINVNKIDENYVMNKIIQFFQLESVMINSIVNTFSSQVVYIKNNNDNEYWSFQPTQYSTILDKLYSILIFLLQNVFGYFLISNFTAFYVRTIIVSSPAIILMPSNQSNNQQYQLISQAFPWIGVYLQAFLQNNLQNKNKYIITSFIVYLMIMYFFYLGGSQLTQIVIFSKSLPLGLDDNFFAFMAIFEFFSYIFLRTRAALLFFPQTFFLLTQLFLFYFQSTKYGFYQFALLLTIQLSFLTFLIILQEMELKSMSWNLQQKNTPSIERPRLMYFPLAQLSNYSDLPQIWSMFYPLYARSMFTTQQMALVDSNYQLINQLMEQEGHDDNFIMDPSQNENQTINLHIDTTINISPQDDLYRRLNQ